MRSRRSYFVWISSFLMCMCFTKPTVAESPWRQSGPPRSWVYALDAHRDADGLAITVYAGSRSAVYRSDNGGSSWQRAGVSERYDGPRVIRAHQNRPGSVLMGTSFGLYISEDYAETWSPTSLEAEFGFLVIEDIEIDPLDPAHLYAGTSHGDGSTTPGALWESDDYGWTWSVTYELGYLNGCYDVELHPATGQTYIATGNGILVGGSERWWINIGPSGKRIDEIAIDPHGSHTIFVRSGGEVLRYDGHAWHVMGPFGAHPTVMLFDLGDGGAPSPLYVGFTDGVRRTFDTGETWELLDDGLVDRYVLAMLDVSLNSVDEVMTGQYRFGGVYARDRREGPWHTSGNGISDLGIADIVVDVHDQDTVYLGSSESHHVASGYGDGVWRSIDGGRTWEAMSQGMTSSSRGIRIYAMTQDHQGQLYATSDYDVYRWDGASNVWVSILHHVPPIGLALFSDIAVDPSDDNVLWVARSGGFSDNNVYRSTDGGQTWDTLNVFTTGWAQVIAIDPQDSNTVYIGGHHFTKIKTGYVYKTTDGGDTWSDGVFVDGGGVTSLTVDTQDSSHVLLTTYSDEALPGYGVRESYDGGDSWSERNTGLPSRTGVTDLIVSPTNGEVLLLSTASWTSGSQSSGLYASVNGPWQQYNSGLQPEFQCLALAYAPHDEVLWMGTRGDGLFIKALDDDAIRHTDPVAALAQHCKPHEPCVRPHFP